MTAQADRITQLLKNEDLQTAFDDCRRAIHEGWARTLPSDADALQEWHRRLFTLQSVEANLKRAIQDGHLEDFRAQEQVKPEPLGDLLTWRMKNKQ